MNNNIIYPDGTYACIKHTEWYSGKVLLSLTGFIKDDDGETFSLEHAKVLGGKQYPEPVRMTRKNAFGLEIKPSNTSLPSSLIPSI